MHVAQELTIILVRVVTILPLFLFVVLKMGKRSIGQLPVFDFMVLVLLGAVVGADIDNPNLPHLYTTFAVLCIFLFQFIVARLAIFNRYFGWLITFEPTIVVRDGKFLVENLKNIHYSIDTILLMLREQGIFDLREVDLAIVEADGQLSVHKNADKTAVTLGDLGIKHQTGGVAFPVVIEGNIYTGVLQAMNLDDAWLQEQLHSQGVRDIGDVFFASVDEQHQLYVSMRSDGEKAEPPLMH